MLRFLKKRIADSGRTRSGELPEREIPSHEKYPRVSTNERGELSETGSPQQLALGRLEFELMQILWSRGECNVRDVVRHLDRPLAYTTVMTTLDRLYKKGLLDRHMPERAFLYSTRISSQEWERQRASSILAGFFAGPHPSRELLVSSFLDAVGERDAVVLDELEKKIRSKRRELNRRGQS